MSSYWDNAGLNTEGEKPTALQDLHQRAGPAAGGGRNQPVNIPNQPNNAANQGPNNAAIHGGGRNQPVKRPNQPNNAANQGPNNAAIQRRRKASIVLKEKLKGIRKWDVVILILALCASLCHTFAFASGSWMQNDKTHIGLWTDCNCTSYSPDGDIANWVASSKVFLGIAVLVAVGTAFTIPVYTALEDTSRKQTLAKVLYKCSDGTVLLVLIGCLPVGLLFDKDYTLGVGFALCVVAALLCLPRHGLLALRDQANFLYKFNWPHTAITLCYLIAVHFILVSYVTSSWASDGNKQHVGLWLNCACGGSTFKDGERHNTLKAVQAMITVGEMLLLLNVFILGVLAGLPMNNTRRTKLITSIYIIAFAAGISTVVADVMFATAIVDGYSVDYSFIFSVLSAIFCIISSCIAVLRRSSERSQTRPVRPVSQA